MSDIEQGIKNVLESLAETFEAEKQSNFGELAERILESESGSLWWKNPENFSVGFALCAGSRLRS
jgi:hypothetical protein